MAGSLQLPKRFLTPADLLLSSGVEEAKLLAHGFGQLTAMKKLFAFEQLADVFYVRGLRQCPFDLILCVHSHAVRMHDTRLKVQILILGKGQA